MTPGIQDVADCFTRKDDLPAIIGLCFVDQAVAVDFFGQCERQTKPYKEQSGNHDTMHFFFTFFATYTTSAKTDMNSSRASHMMTI